MISNVLVIGLGSMGKRRIRCLQALGINRITGMDLRADRRLEGQALYGIQPAATLQEALQHGPFDAWIISVPPDCHHIYMREAINHKTPAFIEASVVDTGMDQIIADAHEAGVLLAPSCTMLFHPAIRLIMQTVREGRLGRLSQFLYHSGQYLPDWHSYEPVSDYYVSRRETGGAREIVPFELSWITTLLGFPGRVACLYKKTIELPGAEEIDDNYNLLMDYDGFIFNLTVDVVSRCATRRLLINGDQGQLYWDWDAGHIRIYDAATGAWEEVSYQAKAAQEGYNKNITEGMYIEEVQAFLDAVLQQASFPNSLEHDHRILKLLYAAERSCDSGQMQAAVSFTPQEQLV